MPNLQQLRQQCFDLWCRGKSIADMQRILNVRIVMGGDLGGLHYYLATGNFGVYPA